MSGGDHRPAAPFDPAAHPNPFAGKRLDVDTGRRERSNVLAVDADGEVAPPIVAEVEIDAPAALPHLGNGAFDELIRLGESAEPIDVVGALDAIG
jgi:hypothetical protein